MKAFFLSILLAVSSFFGTKDKLPQTLPTPQPTRTVIPTIEVQVTVTPTPRLAITPKPTKVSKPKTSITEEILKTFFGISEKNYATQILNDPSQLQRYEQEYYQKFKTHPIPKIAVTDLKKQIVMPSKNGPIVCTGEQLKNLYSDIDKTEKEIEYQRMNMDCHTDGGYPERRYNQESKECQEWRRDNDQNRTNPTVGPRSPADISNQIGEYSQKLEDQKNLYDQLIVKYCLN